jgi:HTH-type transcriptional regulator, global nitrogen regulator NrpRI
MPVKDRKSFAILRTLELAGEALGSTRLSEELAAQGIDLTERAIRYHLRRLDEDGLTEACGRDGRRITPLGRRELADAGVSDKVALVNAKLEKLAYQTDLDLTTQEGRVIVNVSLLPEDSLSAALQVMRPVFASRLCTSDLVRIYRPGETVGESEIPAGQVGVGTICAVTVNGILLHHGIPMHSEFGGLLEMEAHEPVRFTDIIHYGGTSLDPLEIFIKGKMTSVTRAARGETGKVGAGFRVIPAAAREQFLRLAEEMGVAGIRGVAAVGRPGQPLLEMPVPLDRVGVILYAGLNPGAAVEEAGIPTENKAMTDLVEFSELISFRKL